MAASDLTAMAYILKKLYGPNQVQEQTLRDQPGIMMCRREGGFTGNSFSSSLRTGNPQGVSGTFADARSGASASKGKQPEMFRKPKYGYITIDGETIAACDGNMGSFMRVVEEETDGILESFGDDLGFNFYRDGSGQRGRRSSASSNTVTLTSAYDARNFQEGMTVIASDQADGSSPRSGSTTVTHVDEDSGTITLTSAAAISGFTNNDYLFRKGDPDTCMEGLSAHFPLTAPSSGDSFRGVDRSVNVRKLAGVRIDDTATPIHENIGLLAVKISTVARRSNRKMVCLLNPLNFYDVARRLDAKVTYDGAGMTASTGFEGIDVHTTAGNVRCVSDPQAPLTLGYVVDYSTLMIKHLRELPHIVMDDGVKSLRITDEDGIEARVRGWCNMWCGRPGANGVFSIAA